MENQLLIIEHLYVRLKTRQKHNFATSATVWKT